MEWHVVVFGDLVFPPGGATRWRELVVDPDRWDDWSDGLLRRASPINVATLLERFVHYPGLTGGQARIDVELGDAAARMRGYLADDAFRAHATEVAALFRAAAGANARGTLVIAHVGAEYAYRVSVDPGRSSCAKIAEPHEVEALLSGSAAEEAAALYADSFATAPPRATRLPGSTQKGGLETATDCWTTLLGRLTRFTQDEIFEALRARGGFFFHSKTKSEPVGRAFPDAAALIGALREGGPPSIRPLGLELLQRLDARAAKESALEILASEAPDELLLAATLVLREAPEEDALTALAGALVRPPLDRRTPLRSALLASLSSATSTVAEKALGLLGALADDDEAHDACLAIVELAASRALPLPVAAARRLLEATVPPTPLRDRLRELVATSLLGQGSAEALATLETHAESPGLLGRSAVRAIFRSRGAAGFEKLVPLLEGPARLTVLAHVLWHLGDVAATSSGKAREVRDPRAVELALGALEMPGAVVLLGYCRDPRVPGALTALLPTRFEEVCQALRRLRDPSVLPALEAAAQRAPNPHSAKLVATTIAHLQKATERK